MTDLTSLFTAVAQVTFTLAGLLAIAVVGDEHNRRFWLGLEPRAVFVFLSFMFLLIPGVFSIGGLVFSSSNAKLAQAIPAWPFSAAIAGGLYWLMVLFLNLGLRSARRLRDRLEFRRLDNQITITRGYRYIGSGFLLFAGLGFYQYGHLDSLLQIEHADLAIGAYLTIVVLTEVVISVQFFRFDTEAKGETTSTVDSQPTEITLSTQSGASGHEPTYASRDDLSKGSLVVLLALLLAFVAGILITRTTEQFGK